MEPVEQQEDEWWQPQRPRLERRRDGGFDFTTGRKRAASAPPVPEPMVEEEPQPDPRDDMEDDMEDAPMVSTKKKRAASRTPKSRTTDYIRRWGGGSKDALKKRIRDIMRLSSLSKATAYTNWLTHWLQTEWFPAHNEVPTPDDVIKAAIENYKRWRKSKTDSDREDPMARETLTKWAEVLREEEPPAPKPKTRKAPVAVKLAEVQRRPGFHKLRLKLRSSSEYAYFGAVGYTFGGWDGLQPLALVADLDGNETEVSNLLRTDIPNLYLGLDLNDVLVVVPPMFDKELIRRTTKASAPEFKTDFVEFEVRSHGGEVEARLLPLQFTDRGFNRILTAQVDPNTQLSGQRVSFAENSPLQGYLDVVVMRPRDAPQMRVALVYFKHTSQATGVEQVLRSELVGIYVYPSAAVGGGADRPPTEEDMPASSSSSSSEEELSSDEF